MNRLDEDQTPYYESSGAASGLAVPGGPHPGQHAPATPPPAAPPVSGGSVHAGMRRRGPHAPIIPAYHPSATERLGAAFRARKRELIALAALILGLVLGIVGTTVGMVRAARQRDAALAATAEAQRLRTVAETGRREAAAVSEFLEAVLGSVNPWGADRAAEVSVQQVLDVAAARLDAGSLKGQKEAEARLRGTLGQAYAGLALSSRAEPQFRKALELHRELRPRQDHPDTAQAMNALAMVLLESRPPRTKEAEQMATEALEMRRRLWGPSHKEVADSLDTLSAVNRVQRDYFAAERRVNEALEMRRRLPPDAKTRTGLASSLTHRATLLWRKGELTATISDLGEAMENYRGELPDDHLLLAALHSRLGAAFFSQGNRNESINHYRQALDIRRRHRPESHGDVAEPLRRLGLMLRERGDFADAEKLLADRDSRLRGLPGAPDDLRTELCGLFVGLYQAWGKPEKAEPWAKQFRESIGREIDAATARIEKAPKSPSPREAPAVANLYCDRARLRVRAGQFEPAAADFRRGIELDPADHWPWFYQGCLLAYLGDEKAYREHCAQMLARFGNSPDSHVLDCTVKTCSLLPGGAGGDPQRLNQIANQVWAIGNKEERNEHWFRLLKGIAEYREGSPERAINWLTGSLAPELPHRTATAHLYLAMAHHRRGNAGEARAALDEAEKRVRRFVPRTGAGDLAEGGIENWLICQTTLREARALLKP